MQLIQKQLHGLSLYLFADTDADGLSDGDLNPEENPGCENTYDPHITGVNDFYPTGDPTWTIVFEVRDESNQPITGTWLPKPHQQ